VTITPDICSSFTHFMSSYTPLVSIKTRTKYKIQSHPHVFLVLQNLPKVTCIPNTYVFSEIPTPILRPKILQLKISRELVFRREICRNMKLIPQLQLQPILRIRGLYPQSPLCHHGLNNDPLTFTYRTFYATHT
jgi:hypothetical protein